MFSEMGRPDLRSGSLDFRVRAYWGYIGIMEIKMETTIMG